MTEEECETKLSTYILEFILIFTALIIVIIQILCFGNLFYKSGLANNDFYVLKGMFWSAVLTVLLTAVLSVAASSLVKAAIRAHRNKMTDRPKILLLLAPFPIAFFFFFKTVPHRVGAVDFLQGYERWVQNEVDIPAIQKWLASLNASYSNQHYLKGSLPENLPEAITKLKPQSMDFSEFAPGKRSVTFEWGGALGCRGIFIGLTGTETPADGYVGITENQQEYRRSIQSGVYIFDRINIHEWCSWRHWRLCLPGSFLPTESNQNR